MNLETNICQICGNNRNSKKHKALNCSQLKNVQYGDTYKNNDAYIKKVVWFAGFANTMADLPIKITLKKLIDLKGFQHVYNSGCGTAKAAINDYQLSNLHGDRNTRLIRI